LILHGDQDQTVFMNQSERLRDAYREAKLDVTLQVVPGGRHGGEVYYQGDHRRLVVDFLNKHLRKRDGDSGH
jgi:dipeptidyl aminopeptidase/acylaminoacyl peptidase